MQLLTNLELKDRDATLSNLLELCQAQKIAVLEPELILLLQELRDRTSSIINLATLPTTRDEEWRFTDLSALRQLNFSENTSPQIDISSLILPEAENSRLVFVNGVYTSELSRVADLPDGITVSNLAGLPITHRSKIKKYLAQQQGATEVFTALNTSGISDVAIVWVGKNVVVDTPIHLLFVSTSEQPIVSQPRCLLVAESGSNVTVVEEYKKAGSADTVYFTNSVTEIWLEENAEVSHTRIEQESLEAFHIGKTAVSQARDSRYTCYAVSLGGKLSRHNLEVFQAGEQTDTNLFGLTAISGNQVGDTHSAIALNYPHGTTNQLHKCIVSEKSHGVFNGKVFVPKPAQLTNAAQLNRNLLLSSRARIDTKPQLEITADNVKCSHGATVSQLEDDEIFYLQSRGINASDARNLLVNAFAAEIINKLPIDSLRESLNASIKRFSTVS
ncbi:Fe-S cluster assembly protein SufD [Synechocystis sp. PCC 7509]|uniref:Fe-S cluster assembly protein SufD n=1 Tax=Synechocystis sp. PCC 7509 TaxID=927677 RepID=UPI0002ACE633|nr:Fe-S cluster assembly protein SufD [Synechocystis sp. PCC 7509]